MSRENLFTPAMKSYVTELNAETSFAFYLQEGSKSFENTLDLKYTLLTSTGYSICITVDPHDFLPNASIGNCVSPLALQPKAKAKVRKQIELALNVGA